jgi:secreted PhoX family phosphatase
VQQTSKTITSGVNRPTGLAFDPYGNLWAANDVGGSSSVTEYTNGVQNTGNTITQDIVAPLTASTTSGYWIPKVPC